MSVEDDIAEALKEIETKEGEENEIIELQESEEPVDEQPEQGSEEEPEEGGEGQASEKEPKEELKEEAAEKTTSDDDAPVSWSGLYKQKWKDIPSDVRKYIQQREEEAHKALTKHDEERNFGRSLKEIATPYIPTIQAEGGSVEGAFKDLLNVAYVLRTGNPMQKAQVIRENMRAFNVDPALVFGQQQQQNPQLSAIENELQQLKQEREKERLLQEEQNNSTIQQEIEAFASNPSNVYFNDVRDIMATLLNSGQAQGLEEAYEKAIWAHPQVRAALLEKQNAETQEKRKKELEAKKKAASSVTGSPDVKSVNSTKKVSKKASIEEDIAAAFEELESASSV